LADRHLAGLRVLIVEDEFLIAMDVEQTCLEQGAAEVTIMRTVGEVNDALAQGRRYDIAILDLTVSGESTLDLAGGLRGASIPFIFATGYPDNPHITQAHPDAIVVAKPFMDSALVNALQSALTAD
jgi:CheY-like chemotaxis protein